MTRQVTEGQPITVVARSQVGGFIPDAPLTVDGEVYRDPGLSESFDEHKANGAGEFIFYAAAGTVINITVDDPIGVGMEPIQVVGVAGRPGGIAAVHPEDTPAVHEASPLSEHVTDSSLVGAVAPGDALPEDQGGAAAVVGVDRAQNVPPTTPEGDGQELGPNELMARDVAVPETPDGTNATDPDAVAPPATQTEQVTPMYEPQPTDGSTTVAPESVTAVDAPTTENSAGTAADVHGQDSPAVDAPVAPNADGTQTSNEQQAAAQPSPEVSAGTSEAPEPPQF